MLSLALALGFSYHYAAVPCGNSGAGVLNVGFLPVICHVVVGILSMRIGFDPFLIQAVAKMLGYDPVNFIGYGNAVLALLH